MTYHRWTRVINSSVRGEAMIERQEIIKKYFDAWLNKNSSMLKEIFDLDTIYSECYGTEYHGIEVIEKWFKEWNKRGEYI